MVKMDTWDEMRCPECDAWFYPEKNMRKWCEKCNDKEIEGETLQERADRTNPYLLKKEIASE
jgi:uncharacterized OB-fold protein